ATHAGTVAGRGRYPTGDGLRPLPAHAHSRDQLDKSVSHTEASRADNTGCPERLRENTSADCQEEVLSRSQIRADRDGRKPVYRSAARDLSGHQAGAARSPGIRL